MENKIRKHVDNLFKTFEQDENTLDTKEELISNLLERINDSVESGLSEEEAFNKAIGNLGTKKDIKRIFNFKTLDKMNFEYKLNQTYAAIATVIYLVLGFGFDLWHPGWAIYIVAVAFSKFIYNDKKSYLIPAISLIYTFIGIMWDYWHPGWIIFPIGFTLLATMDKKYGSLFLMAGAIYAILGVLFGYWLLFSIIFVFASALVAGRDEFTAGLWIFTIAIYLLLGIMFNLWHPGWLVFGVAVVLTTAIEEKSIVGSSWMASITVYLFLGFVYGLWHPSWIIFIAAAAVSAYLEEGVEIKKVDISDEESIPTIKEKL